MKRERGHGGDKPNLKALTNARFPRASFPVFYSSIPPSQGSNKLFTEMLNGIWKCVGRKSDSLLFQMAGAVPFVLGTLDK